MRSNLIFYYIDFNSLSGLQHHQRRRQQYCESRGEGLHKLAIKNKSIDDLGTSAT